MRSKLNHETYFAAFELSKQC